MTFGRLFVKMSKRFGSNNASPSSSKKKGQNSNHFWLLNDSGRPFQRSSFGFVSKGDEAKCNDVATKQHGKGEFFGFKAF